MAGVAGNGGRTVDADGKGTADESPTPVGDSAADVRRGEVQGDGVQESMPPQAASGSPELGSLASRYEAEHHETYLRHLESAVKDSRNLNIALTGRYGTGKSSVLDQFEASHKKETVRLAITSLGADSEKASLTNRIEKELVKQLLYRGSPRQLPDSRFHRIVPLSLRRAAIESVAAVAGLWLGLAFLGWLPAVAGTSSTHPWYLRMVSWIGFGILIAAALVAARLSIHDRFFVSDVSAGGARVTLTQRTSTYFDEYLDEIVYFFERVSPAFVIFEDLDRFKDPHIFEALRELNTILNNAGDRKNRRPLRFIYAIKDSLFERLGTEADDVEADAAAAENVRANRTKFFDVVIPMVPFISHRNARELLSKLLEDLDIVDVDRPLVALIAKHVTDMRLLRNICNEYIVFAERLLGAGMSAPGLTASNLFSLVAYKNFHLKDFEDIVRRRSSLDRLYDQRREFVRSEIETREALRRKLATEGSAFRSMSAVAEQLGARLEAYAQGVRAPRRPNSAVLTFAVDSEEQPNDKLTSYEFWQLVASCNELSASTPTNVGTTQTVLTLKREQLEELFPEAFEAGRWPDIDEARHRAAMQELKDDIAFLRGADFKQLAANRRFKLKSGEAEETFSEIVDRTMASALAQDLVKQGYIDRNFALYAAQFYGDFTGVDVATFIVQSVQTNSMDIDYTFDTPGAVANLLDEAPSDFTRTRSAYNVDVLDYLLRQEEEMAKEVVDSIVSNRDEDSMEFLKAYLNSGGEPSRLAALLSSHPWAGVFRYLVEDDVIPTDARAALVDAALLSARKDSTYELDQSVRDYITANYMGMSAFTSAHDKASVDAVATLIEQSGVILPDLSGLHKSLRDEVVRRRLYRLTADNLRTALGVTGGVSVDRLIANEDIYSFVSQNPSEYLAAIEHDPQTPQTVVTASALAEFLNDVASSWDEEQLDRFVGKAAPESKLKDLSAVPVASWPALARVHLFRSTLANVEAYREAFDGLDRHLAHLLVEAGSIETEGEDEEVKTQAAIAILNASDVIPSPATRTALVRSLDVANELPVSAIDAAPDELLALLLEESLVADSAESFEHFRSAGWSAIGPAIEKSEDFSTFMTPDLVEGLLPHVLRSSSTPMTVRMRIMDNLGEFTPSDDPEALRAAAEYAVGNERGLPLDEVRRVAAATKDARLTLSLLTLSSPLPDAADVVAVLGQLEKPYAYLSTHERTEFEVPDDDDHRTVFERLKRQGVLSEFKKKRLRDVRVAKLRVP